MYTHYVGLDLGKVQDYTALAVLQQHQGEERRHYTIPWLQRFPKGTEYHTVVVDVGVILRALASQAGVGRIALVVDATGVGEPVVELLRRAPLPADLYDITITSGDAPNHEGLSWKVPKRDLVSTVQVMLQARPSGLTMHPGLPDAEALSSELSSFQYKLTEHANDTYGAWREGAHDDLILAVALAAWAGEQKEIPELKGLYVLPFIMGVKVRQWGKDRDWLTGRRD